MHYHRRAQRALSKFAYDHFAWAKLPVWTLSLTSYSHVGLIKWLGFNLRRKLAYDAAPLGLRRAPPKSCRRLRGKLIGAPPPPVAGTARISTYTVLSWTSVSNMLVTSYLVQKLFSGQLHQPPKYWSPGSLKWYTLQLPYLYSLQCNFLR